MVNGAGLAMATMDIVKYYGAEPANFLDVGGGANAEKVAAAFRILLSDSRVKAVLINIFGGIMRCDVLAQGVVDAASEVNLSVPLVVRMEGTNVEEGKQILAESGIKVIAANDMADAARRVVERSANQDMASMSILVNKNTRVLTQGITGATGQLHTRACREYGTQMVGGVMPGKGGTDFEGIPIFDTRRAGAQSDRRQRHRDLRAAAVRGRRDPRSRRRRNRARRSASPRAFRSSTWCGCKRYLKDSESAPDRAELSRHHHAGRVQDRHHARLHPQAGRRRRGIAQRHADLRGRLSAHPARASDNRPASASAAIRSSAPTTIDALRALPDDPETDAIIMIGEIGGTAEEEAADVHQAHVKKAGGSVHRRADGAEGPAHGARRRHHRRRTRHRGRQDRGARSRRHHASR